MTELPDPEEWARHENRYPAPEGTAFAWRADTGEGFGLEWSTEPEKVDGKRCRFGASRARPACGEPAVAALNRGKRDRPRWWAYCAEHLFGRVLVDGVVYSLILVELEEEVAGDA